jgi:hypothetical protein
MAKDENATTTIDGQPPRYWSHDGKGGYCTNVRAICDCGRMCECAGDTRCNRCQEFAVAVRKERERTAANEFSSRKERERKAWARKP